MRARWTCTLPLAALLGLVAVAPLAAGPMDSKFDPKSISTPALNPIKKVSPIRYVLPNGLVVYLLEDHSLPRVRGEFVSRTSAVWIPDSKAGMGGMTGEVMRSGGTAAHPGDWMDDRLGSIGASISTSLTTDQCGGSFSCLAENTAEVVALFSEVLQAPAFPEDKIELAKVGIRQSIASRNDDMIGVLVAVARESVFGKGSIFARRPEYATVEAIERADLVGLHQKAFVPERGILAVYGDFNAAALKSLIQSRFGAWKKSGVLLAPMPEPRPRGEGKVYFAPKNDVTQSGIILTHLGFRQNSPDYPAMSVLENALGGGFSSRLFNKIRTERGLAYAAGAGAGDGVLRPGNFIAYSLTRSESTLVALGLLRQEVERISREPITEAELKNAKDAVLNGYVFNFEKPSNVLFRAANLELSGYPADFLQKYQAGVQNVTVQDVLAAAKRNVVPASLNTIIVGKESDFATPLSSLGTVERVDISIPPPASKLKVGAATAEDLAKGQALVTRASDLTGGSAAWSAVKALQTDLNSTMTMQGQKLPLKAVSSVKYPSMSHTAVSVMGQNMSMVTDGKAGWRSMGPQSMDDPNVLEQAAKDYERCLPHLFGNPAGLRIQALGEPRTVDGVAYQVAFVQSEVIKDWVLYFAPDGMLARMDFQGRAQAGPVPQSEVYSDWRPVGTLKFPFSRVMSQEGAEIADSKVNSITVNPTISDDMFRRQTK